VTDRTISAEGLGDAALAQRAAAGDMGAFEELVTRYEGRVYRLACRLTSDTDAPDILQDTFVQVYRNLSLFRGECSFGTWLYRIATNTALMLRRSRARRPAESLDTFLPRFDTHGVHADTPEAFQCAARADEVLDQQLLADKARDAVDRLPDLYREAFVLRDLEDMSTSEVAEVLGVAPATVRQRVHRARLLLRGYLGHLVEVKR